MERRLRTTPVVVMNRTRRASLDQEVRVAHEFSSSRNPARLRGGPRGVIFAVSLVLTFAALASCQRDVEQFRAELATRQASWNSRLATIRTEQEGLKERFGRGIGAPNGSRASSSAGLRTRATIDGLGQSITDVEIQMRQVGPRLDQA